MATLQASQLFDVSGFIALVTGGGSGIGLMVRPLATRLGATSESEVDFVLVATNLDCTRSGE
jgi:hypothetical protein